MTKWGESFFTRWFWAVSLGEPASAPRPRPYILDGRVWGAIGRLGWKPTGRNVSQRYASYCTMVEAAAAASRN
jgi:hypothetical protein